MKRREFLKAIPLAVAVTLTTGSLFASEYEHSREYRDDDDEHKRLNRLKNRANPTVLEQKHVPLIEAPKSVKAGQWFDVKIKVGFMREHPSTPKHWITKIKLFVNGREIAKEKHYVGGINSSEATFRIRLQRSATLEAIEHCNLHGTWIGDPFRIEVI